MNLLQMSCVMTWAQKKSASNLKKKKGRFFEEKKIKLGFPPRNFSFEKKRFSCQPQKCELEYVKRFRSSDLFVFLYSSTKNEFREAEDPSVYIFVYFTKRENL